MNNTLHLIDEPRNVQQEPINFGSLANSAALADHFLGVLDKRRSGIKTHADTGIASLDAEVPCLLEDGDLTVVAARPGMGKTCFGVQLMGSVAQQGKSGIFFSLEMSYLQLVERHIAAATGLSLLKLRNPLMLTADDEKVMAKALSDFGSMQILVDETPKTIDELVEATIKAKISLEAAGMPKLGVILVDYLTKIYPSRHASTNDLEIKEISRKLKDLAKMLQVPVIALAQLNRSVEQRPNKRPIMSDLRESGTIEQDADTILFLYRDEVYDPDTKDKGVAEVIVGKRRMFDLATVKLAFEGARFRFGELGRCTSEQYARKSGSLKNRGGQYDDPRFN